MKKIKFTVSENIIVAAIEEKGEFVWDSVHYPGMKESLKEMMWKGFIKRKEEPCTQINVFVPTYWLRMAIFNNNAADIINGKK